MRQSTTRTVKAAARWSSHRFLAAALIVLASALVLPAGAAALGTGGNGRTFAAGVAQATGLGTIVVDSQPSSADVRLDGVDAGLSTPTTFTGVTPGAHQVSVSIPGFQPWEQTVSVTADATTTVEAALLIALPATVDAEVTVTNTSDAIDGDASSIAALQGDPGPDGGISLREAITAANATAGTKVIRFAAALQGAVITPGQVTNDRLPTLIGGDIWIIGDIDGDGAPDVTIDGVLGQVMGGALGIGMSIWSSGDVVSGLNLINYDTGRAVSFLVTGLAKTCTDDRVLGNSVSGGFAVGQQAFADPAPGSNITFNGLMIAGNHVTDGQMVMTFVGSGSAHDNRLTDLTIASNTAGTGDGGVCVGTSDMNTENLGFPPPIQYADHNTLQGLTIEHNRCYYVYVAVANLGNSDCAISDVVIRDNDIMCTSETSGFIGIRLAAGCLSWIGDERVTARDSLTHVEVRGNRIQGAGCGILISAGEFVPQATSSLAGGAVDDVISDVVVADNEIQISNAGARAVSGVGIQAAAGTGWGLPPCSDTTLTGLVISGNLLTNTTTGGVGIRLAGGLSYAGDAPVTGSALTGASVTNNTVRGFAKGIWVSGGDGTGAVGNALTGSSSGNSVSATEPWLIAADSRGASGNMLSFGVAEPMITGFAPTSGPVGTSVTITGANLTEATAVAFNGTPAASFSVVNDTHITVEVPAGATTGVIAVTTPLGAGTSPAAFTVMPKPRIARLSPTSGRRGIIVTIVGTGFRASRGTSYVKFGTTKCGKYLSWSRTRIKCRVPAKAAFGRRYVRVTTVAGRSNAKVFTVKR